MDTHLKQFNYNKIVCQLVLPCCVRVPEEKYQFNNKDITVSLTFRRHVRANEFDHFEVGHIYSGREKE